MKKHIFFSFSIPQTIITASGKYEHAGDVHLSCVANLYEDGSIRCIDIEKAMYCANDICPWISLHDQEVFEEWKSAAMHFATGTLDLRPAELVGAKS